jgi:hypothetical protein
MKEFRNPEQTAMQEGEVMLDESNRQRLRKATTTRQQNEATGAVQELGFFFSAVSLTRQLEL